MNTSAGIYRAIKDDQGCIAQVRAFSKELALACVDPAQSMETTSFTLNGQSGAGQLRATKAQLLQLCLNVLVMVDNNAEISTRSTQVFMG